MGWELTLTSLPPTCKLLRDFAAGRFDGELLGFIDVFYRYRREPGWKHNDWARGDSEYLALCAALEDLLVQRNGVEQPQCELDRRFDWLRWLLEQTANTDEERSLATVAVKGEAMLHPPGQGTQGFWHRWNSAETCCLISIWLSEVSEANLTSHFDPPAMEKLGLYKWFADHVHEQTLPTILSDFHALRSFYTAVVAHDEGVLIVCD